MLGERTSCDLALICSELIVETAAMSIVVRALPSTTVRALRPRILKALAAGPVQPYDWRIALDAAGADSLDDRHTLDRCGIHTGDQLFVTRA